MQTAEVVSPGLRKLLVAVLVIFSLLVVDSVYLATVTFLQWLNDVTLENAVYQTAFLAHLVLGSISDPVCTGHWLSPVQQQACTT